MKKLSAIALCVLLLLSLTGCGKDEAPAPTAAPTAAPTQAPAAETLAPAQAATEAPAEQTKDVTEIVEAIRAMIGQPVQDLYDFIGEPTGGTDYGPSCLVTGGQDGQLFYDGFCVYTLVKPDGSESIYDIEAN